VKVEQMRQLLLAVYASKNWRLKVRIMPDTQIVAIFKRLRTQGKV